MNFRFPGQGVVAAFAIAFAGTVFGALVIGTAIHAVGFSVTPLPGGPSSQPRTRPNVPYDPTEHLKEKYRAKFEHCYINDSVEFCHFTITAVTTTIIANTHNNTKAYRSDGSSTNSCCLYFGSEDQGHHIYETGAEALTEEERRVIEPGRSVIVGVGILDHKNDDKFLRVHLSLGNGDQGVDFPVNVPK